MNFKELLFKQLHSHVRDSTSEANFEKQHGVKRGELKNFLKKYGIKYQALKNLNENDAEKKYGGFYHLPFPEKEDIKKLTDDDIKKYLSFAPNKSMPAIMLQINPNAWWSRVNKLGDITLNNFNKDEVAIKIEEEDIIVNNASETENLNRQIEENIVKHYNEVIRDLKETPDGKDKVFLTLEEMREYFEVRPSNIPGAGYGLFLIKELPPEKNVNGVILGLYICDEYIEEELLKTYKSYNIKSNQLNIKNLGYLVNLGENDKKQTLIGMPNKQHIELARNKVIAPLHFLNHAPNIYFYRAKEDVVFTHKDAKKLFDKHTGYILQGDNLYYIGKKKKVLIATSTKLAIKDLFSDDEVLELASNHKLTQLEQLIDGTKTTRTNHTCPANTALYTMRASSGKQIPVVEILNPLEVGEGHLCYGNNPFPKEKIIDLPLINQLESIPVLQNLKGAFPFSAIKVEEKKHIREVKIKEFFDAVLNSQSLSEVANKLNIDEKRLIQHVNKKKFDYYKANVNIVSDLIEKWGNELFINIFRVRLRLDKKQINYRRPDIKLSDISIKRIHEAICELKEKDSPYNIANMLSVDRAAISKYLISTGVFKQLKNIKLDKGKGYFDGQYDMTLKSFLRENEITVANNRDKKLDAFLEPRKTRASKKLKDSALLEKRMLPQEFNNSLELEDHLRQDNMKKHKKVKLTKVVENSLTKTLKNPLSDNSLSMTDKKKDNNKYFGLIENSLFNHQNIDFDTKMEEDDLKVVLK